MWKDKSTRPTKGSLIQLKDKFAKLVKGLLDREKDMFISPLGRQKVC